MVDQHGVHILMKQETHVVGKFLFYFMSYQVGLCYSTL